MTRAGGAMSASPHQPEPGGADIERQHRGVGDVETLDLAWHVEPRHRAAGLARQLPQALALAAERMMAPTLCGSVIWSSTRMMPSGSSVSMSGEGRGSASASSP